VLVVATVGAALLPPGDASACGFFDYREVRPVRVHPKPVPADDRIAAADQRLDEERLTEAGNEVISAFPSVRTMAAGGSPLESRARRILALAVVRGQGSLRSVRGFAATTPAARGENVDWALGVLRSIDAERRDDPVSRADLAEGLAALGRHEDEAYAILADLTARDLVGSAHAYAALARIRSAHGDAQGARAALQRCELMTRSPSTVCKAPDGRIAARE
jgi:hypothetical protein